MLINGGTRHRDQMKRRENQNNNPRKNKFKGNPILLTNNQINDKQKATHKSHNQTQKS